jgi:hypothetical protein
LLLSVELVREVKPAWPAADRNSFSTVPVV